MLPSNQRLSRDQVTSFLKSPEIKVIFNRLGTLKYLNQSNNVHSTNTITVITGSKQQKKAVLRNKIRRQIYTAFRKNPYNISIEGMLYVSKQSYELSYQEITDLLHALLSKIEKQYKILA
jgi:ribonuclease P protein component